MKKIIVFYLPQITHDTFKNRVSGIHSISVTITTSTPTASGTPFKTFLLFIAGRFSTQSSLGKKGCALFLEIVHRTILLVCGPSIAENRVELLRLGRSFAQIGARDGTNENQNKCNFVLNMANTRNHHKKSHIKTKGKCQDTQATYIFMPSTVTTYLLELRKLNWKKKIILEFSENPILF